MTVLEQKNNELLANSKKNINSSQRAESFTKAKLKKYVHILQYSNAYRLFIYCGIDNDVISYEFETSAESLAVCNGKQGTCDRLITHILPLKFSVFMSL